VLGSAKFEQNRALQYVKRVFFQKKGENRKKNRNVSIVFSQHSTVSYVHAKEHSGAPKEKSKITPAFCGKSKFFDVQINTAYTGQKKACIHSTKSEIKTKKINI